MNSRYILDLVQKESDNFELHKYNRRNEFIFLRYIYFQLCKEFTSESLYSIGMTVERDHATVLHGYKKFEELTSPNVYKGFAPYFKIYNRIHRSLVSLKGEYRNVKKPRTAYELQLESIIKAEYAKKLFKIIDKNHSVINNLMLIKDSVAIKKIAELPPEDVREFERMANVFYKRKMSEKQYA